MDSWFPLELEGESVVSSLVVVVTNVVGVCDEPLESAVVSAGRVLVFWLTCLVVVPVTVCGEEAIVVELC